MDSSVGHEPPLPAPSNCRLHQFHHHNSVPPPPHHHHHHFHVSPHCPFHSYMIHLKNHSPTCPIFASPFRPPQNQETLASVSYPINPLDIQSSHHKETIFNTSSAMPEEKAVEMEEEQQEEEEDEDPIFVLTDEWKEFFAKSEAKRRLAKKQARKKGKNRMEQ